MVRGIIKVLGKGDKERLVGIGVTTRKAIIHYMMLRRSDAPELWLTEERNPLSPHGIQSIIRFIKNRAGITGKRRGVHRFRHTFAEYEGVRVRPCYSPAVLGHTDIATTRFTCADWARTSSCGIRKVIAGRQVILKK